MTKNASQPKPHGPFAPRTILKRDIFSEIVVGAFEDEPQTTVTHRRVAAAATWAKPLAWHLARREIAALKALAGVPNTPQLLGVDRSGLYRSWIAGTPLHIAKPKGDEAYFRDAKRLLRALHRRGVTHNDLAKPQNWLITPDGHAALIDMQLATIFKRRTALFRLMAREDLRHLLKQKRSFCKAALTPRERQLLAVKSVPARLWLKTGKPVYNLVTRGLFRWSDGEGTHDRIDTDGPQIARHLDADADVVAYQFSLFPYPRKQGVGIYAFVEPRPGADADAIEARIAALPDPRPDLVQCVTTLPRTADGTVRNDLLRLVAINQVDRVGELVGPDAALAELMHQIAAGRRNWSDRRLRR
ncbi:serine/threonine protein kinase [Consotaella aegiceratis]|uniref:serine/threonine protein kinase n=1 Tax=Consotaella aegiceratis TaxID=3097961 RepID=UPI002F3FC90B